MTKPMLERYEQILSQDPTSTVFVELAKALLEKGEPERAIDVCKGGLEHHAESIIGRVLWGKSLIQLGRPAEAMEQFDQAIAIDRDNPYAYNLIAEVLLQKGLYRSALPLLRRAATLQPNDARIKQWLEATQSAVSGGPAPVLGELPPLDPPPPEEDESHHHEATQVVNVAEALRQDAARKNGSAQDGARKNGAAPDGARKNGAASDGGRKNGAPPVLQPVDVAPPRGDNDATAAYKVQQEEPQTPQSQLPSLEGLSEQTVVPSAEVHLQQQQPTAPAPARPSARQHSAKQAMLDEIPDFLPEPNSSLEVPKVELSSQATEAIAKEYERELRQKLELKVEKQRRSFLSRNWIKISAAVVVIVAAAAFAGIFLHTRQRNAGRDLNTAIADGKRAALQDTALSYAESLQLLSHAAEMDGSSEEVWAWTAYAHAMLYGEHGREPSHLAAAKAAQAKVSAGPRFVDLMRVVDYELADGKGREAKKPELLEAAQTQTQGADSYGSSLLQELAGRILLAKGDAKGAIERMQKALGDARENVRAQVAVGDYYRDAGDYKNALARYGGDTARVSPKHPQRVLGAAEARLELGQDLPEALAEIEALPPENVTPPLRTEKELVHGRVLAANGKHADAIARVSAAVKASPGYAPNLALAEVYKMAGDPESAGRAADAALKSKDTVEARELLGRTLLMRDRDRELLNRLPATDDRRISLLRGIALVRTGDPKRARSELAKTQVAGKYPSEAVIYLALADAAEGQQEKAQEVLEKTLEATRRAKADVRVALGQVYWQRGALDKARAQFEEADKEPVGYEAGCALGRLLLSLGFADQAVEPLTRSVTRNGGHAESRTALGTALMASGKSGEAVKQFEAWAQQSPSSVTAHKLLARAQYEQGLLKDADAASARAVKLEPSDAEAHRIRASILFGRGEAKNAFSELERSNKLNSKDPLTFCEIGLAFLRRGATDNATKAFDAAKREDPKAACAISGRLYAKGGNGSVLKELAELQKSAPTMWDRAFAATAASRVHLQLAHLRDARKLAEDAVRMAPGMGVAHLMLGLCAFRAKEEAKAKEALGRALELEPDYGQVHLAYADLLAKGPDADLERAVSEYETYLKLGAGPDEGRVKKLLPNLKKKLAAR